jgi:hypothetical protein
MLGISLLVGCEMEVEYLEISYVKGHHELQSRKASHGC